MRRAYNTSLPLSTRIALGVDRAANWLPETYVTANPHPETTHPLRAALEYIGVSLIQGISVGGVTYGATGNARAGVAAGTMAALAPFATRAALAAGVIASLNKQDRRA